jgi:hypothetical protein
VATNVTAWAWSYSQSRNSARLVLLALAEIADEDGGSLFASVAEIAELAEVSVRTASTAVNALESLGEIAIFRNAGPGGVHRFRFPMPVPDPASDHPAAVRARARAERRAAHLQRQVLLGECSANIAVDSADIAEQSADTAVDSADSAGPTAVSAVGSANIAVGSAKSAPVEPFKTKKNLDARTREEDQPPTTPADAGFSAFLAAYPRVESVERARYAWRRAVTFADPQEITDGAVRYAERIQAEGKDPRYVKGAPRWLDDRDWAGEQGPSHRDQADLSRRIDAALAAEVMPGDGVAYVARQREIIAEVTAAHQQELLRERGTHLRAVVSS